ncbi:mandelate racemase/muconate lactonizing enzyme family protein [Acidimicrobiaceae bacterium USS-CC1]|uniref:Mandelate racemase/muconate lactonizing enzyme family protein n=1 Tax=Acidiferrimicrobium australe TaxID=2664430 RepID=A0ABW9QT92_9ACTN|nr:mandelate racemase/muconate lactonizing enzyme family protein [Acidiferrimicrobium australe]
MRITDVEAIVVGVPPPHFGGRYWIFVRLTTDTGVRGIGEIYGVPFHPSVVEAMVADIAERSVIGADPFQVERLWRQVYSRGFTQRPDASVVAVLAGIETACFDIMGKETGRPVHDLLGGRVRDAVRSYTYIYPAPGEDEAVYTDAGLAAGRAAHYAGLGFTAVKFDPLAWYSSLDPRQPASRTVAEVARYVGAVRDAVGDGVDLLIGTHGQMTPSGAIRLARAIEGFDPLWLEEPVPPEMPEQMALVARATSIPIATGERLATKYEFARVLECRAAAIVQMAVGRVGGILESKKIAAAAETHYVDIAPHLYAGPVEAAANLHLAAATPNFLIQESIETMNGFAAEILRRPLQWDSGFLVVPDEPGLGVELDDDAVARHPYEGRLLHLEMGDREEWSRP